MERTWTGKVFIATSLDGYIARTDGGIAWLIDPPENPDHAAPTVDPPAEFGYEGHMASVDQIVMGRGTYEIGLTFDDWPYPDGRVIVVSTTLSGGDGRVAFVPSIDEALAELARRNASGVYVDGGKVIQEFLRRGLVDELTVTRTPVLLGSGIPLFGALSADIRLTHLGTIAIESGMVTSRYRVVKA